MIAPSEPMSTATGPAAAGRAFDPAVVDPLSGIVKNCFELPTEPDDPRVFCYVSEATNPGRFGIGAIDRPGFGCGVALSRSGAQGAAVGEILERYGASFYDPESLRHAAFDELEEEAVAPEAFALFSSRQHARFDAVRGTQDWIPQRFTRVTRTAWVPGFNLVTRRPILVPAPFVYLPYLYADDEPYVVDCFSTGTACSRDRDEATLKALYEVVERDAVSVTWHASLEPRRIELEPNSATARLYEDRIACQGVRCVLLEATLDVPIPTVIAFLLHEDGGTVVGSSTRLNPAEAATKALLEAAQGRLVWKRELLVGSSKRFADDFHDVVEFSDHPQVYMNGEMRRHLDFLWSSPRTTSLRSLADQSSGDSGRDLATCVAMLDQVGLEPIAIDVTSEDLRDAGYWIIRVVIPGMQPLNARHDSPFLGGSRLRQVPHQLGRASRPLEEEDFNRNVHPFP